MDPATRICNECDLPPRSSQKALLCCSRCRQAWYHDGNCQKLHLERAHGAVCSFKAARRDPKKILCKGLEAILGSNTGGVARPMILSTQHFKRGTVMLMEPPIVFFDENAGRGSHLEMFHSFLGLTLAEQSAILDMTPSQSIPSAPWNLSRDYELFRTKHPMGAEYLTWDIAQQLFVIVNENALVFQLPTSSASFTGLFPMTSKVQHSCSPNSSVTVEGGLVFCTADHDIRPLDDVTISYMSSVYENPRQARRKWLRRTKGLHCMCTRCLTFDECQPIQCTHCALGIMFEFGREMEWICMSCGTQSKRDSDPNIQVQLDRVDELSREMDSIRHLLRHADEDESTNEQDLVQALCDALNLRRSLNSTHPMSWLHMAANRLISEVATDMARHIAIVNGQQTEGHDYMDARVMATHCRGDLFKAHYLHSCTIYPRNVCSWARSNIGRRQGFGL
jgi:hypothetical protein